MALEFGFIPRRVIEDLRDVGNWRVRADAIESLKSLVTDALGPSSLPLPSALAGGPALSGLTDFLVRLLEDPNFKISLTSMQILSEVVKRVGGGFTPEIDGVIPRLVTKLGDNKIVVRHAVLQVLSVLCAEVGAVTVTDRLVFALDDRNARIRGAALGALCLSIGADPEAFRTDEGRDVAERVARKALASHPGLSPASLEEEGLAQGVAEVLLAVARPLGPGRALALLHGSALSDELRNQLSARVRSGDAPQRPNEEGIIDFYARAPSGQERTERTVLVADEASGLMSGEPSTTGSSTAPPASSHANGRANVAGRRRPVRSQHSTGAMNADEDLLEGPESEHSTGSLHRLAGVGATNGPGSQATAPYQLMGSAFDKLAVREGSLRKGAPGEPSPIQATLSDIRRRLGEHGYALGTAGSSKSAPAAELSSVPPPPTFAKPASHPDLGVSARPSPELSAYSPTPSPRPVDPRTGSVTLSWNVPGPRPAALEGSMARSASPVPRLPTHTNPPSFSGSVNGGPGVSWNSGLRDRNSAGEVPSSRTHTDAHPVRFDPTSLSIEDDTTETPKFGAASWTAAAAAPAHAGPKPRSRYSTVTPPPGADRTPPPPSPPPIAVSREPSDTLSFTGDGGGLQPHKVQAGRRAPAVPSPPPREPTFGQAQFDALEERRRSSSASIAAGASNKSIDLAVRLPPPQPLDLTYVGGGALLSPQQQQLQLQLQLQQQQQQQRPKPAEGGRRAGAVRPDSVPASYPMDFGPLTEPVRALRNHPPESDDDDHPLFADRPTSRALSTTAKLSQLKQRAQDRRGMGRSAMTPTDSFGRSQGLGLGDPFPPASAASKASKELDDGFGVELSAASAPFLRPTRNIFGGSDSDDSAALTSLAAAHPHRRSQNHRVHPIPEHPFGMDEDRTSSALGALDHIFPDDLRAPSAAAMPPTTPKATSSVSSALQRLRNKASRGQQGGDLGATHQAPPSPVPPPDPSAAASSFSRTRGAPISRGTMGSAASTFGGAMNGVGRAEDRSAPREFVQSELLPLSSPDKAMRTVLQELISANAADRKELDWLAQYEALVLARRLITHHAATLQRDLHALVVALTPAIDGLRSLTAKTAMILVEEMAASLGRGLDAELDALIPVLLKRAGEQSTAGRENFICQVADQALMCIADSCGEGKVSSTLLASMGHKNGAVRCKVALHVDYLLERRGASLLGGGRPDVLDKLVSSVAILLDEGSLETRTFAKRILWSLRRLGEDPFERSLRRLTETKSRQVRAVFDGQSGPPQPPRRPMSRAPPNSVSTPSSASSASNWDGGFNSTRSRGPADNGFGRTPSNNSNTGDEGAGHGPPVSRAASLNRTLGGGSGSGSGSGGSRRALDGGGLGGSSDPAVLEAVTKANSKEWLARLEAIKAIEEMLRDRPGPPHADDGAAIAECLAQKASDGNAKVALQALGALKAAARTLRDAITSSVHLVVPPLCAALASTNEKLKTAATEALDAVVTAVDPAQILQVLAHSASHAKGPARAALYERMMTVARSCHAKRPNLVQRFAVPAVVAAMQDPKPEVRTAVANAWRGLYEIYGESLTDLQEIPAGAKAKVSEFIRLGNRGVF